MGMYAALSDFTNDDVVDSFCYLDANGNVSESIVLNLCLVSFGETKPN